MLTIQQLIHDKNKIDRTVFYRLDRGDEEVDHHVFFFAEGDPYRVHHSSFETHDFDTQVLGHDWLREKGYKNCWGVGRHVLGSQIFDYWKDPWGHELEHWTDGDLFTAEDGSNKATVRDMLDVQWGSPFPALAGKRAPSFENVGRLMAFNIRLRQLFRRGRKEVA